MGALQAAPSHKPLQTFWDDIRMGARRETTKSRCRTTGPPQTTLCTWQAVQTGFDIEVASQGGGGGGFACPLNFHPGMSTCSYFSPCLEDNVFGFTHNACSRHWHAYGSYGSSQASPEYTAREMQKAVRWALASAAQNDCASLEVLGSRV